MSRKQRNLLFAVAASTLVIGLQSLASGQTPVDAIKQRVEREKILRDEQPKTQKTVAPIGGSTGPTAPPKPTQGNTHK
jgi:hypothetical protein